MRRRRILITVAVLVVVLVAGLVGGVVWVRDQDYLARGSVARVPAAARIVADEVRAPDDPPEVAVLPYRDGAEAVYGLALRNDGPLPVKVTAVARPEPPDENLFMFRTVEVRPSGAFTLEPDEERYVEVVGRLGDCEHYAPGSSEIISAQHVEFEVLGQSLTADVELPRPIEIRITGATRCPRG